MKIGLVHYSAWPVIGGVEIVMREHARLLREAGHSVVVLCAKGGARSDDAGCIPLPSNGLEELSTLNFQLSTSKDLASRRTALGLFLREKLQDLEVVFVHNVLTMPFDIALTAALWDAADALPQTRFVSWTHDVVAANPDYAITAEAPWDLLRKAHPRIEYIAVSDLRKRQLAEVCGVLEGKCGVIPNGIDPLRHLQLTPAVEKLVTAFRLLDRDLVLLHPTRLLRRKNIELSLQVTASLREQGVNAALLITAAHDPHTAEASSYAASLHALRDDLKLAGDAIFVNDHFAVTDADLASLYRLADLLFFPSKQEGFGLPILEAALHCLPVFCTDIEPLSSLPGAIPFPLGTAPEKLAALLMRHVEASATIYAKKKVLREFAWSAIWRNFLAPLLARHDTSCPT